MDMTVTADLEAISPLFEINNNGNLMYRLTAEKTVKVTSSLCFPWLTSSEFISIRDEQAVEVFLIKNLSQLDKRSYDAVSESLLAATFMMNITAIKEINAEFEIRNWWVETEQGPYKFQTAIDYWPQVLHKSSLLIRDVTGNIFFIEDPDTLDENSQHLLWPYLE